MFSCSMEPNVFTFGAALNVCAKSSQWLWALQLLKDMAEHLVRMDVISCSAAMTACEKSKEGELFSSYRFISL